MGKYSINKTNTQGSVGIKVVKPTTMTESSRVPKEHNIEEKTSSRPPPPAAGASKKDEKLSWVKYFIEIAKVVSKRSSCLRHQIGAVIVKDKQILSTGYNGSPHNRRECKTHYGFCIRDKKEIEGGTQLEYCLSAGAHSEMNAIALAAKKGVSVEGADLFLVGAPYSSCEICKSLLLNAGIKTAYIEDIKTGIIEIIDIKRAWNKHPIEDLPDFRRCKKC